MSGRRIEILKVAATNAFLTALYICAVASFTFYGKNFVGDKPDTFFAPVGMLMLLVSSASITGFLIFGRPVLWYWDGKKEEALTLFGYTISIFFLITIVALTMLVVI